MQSGTCTSPPATTQHSTTFTLALSLGSVCSHSALIEALGQALFRVVHEVDVAHFVSGRLTAERPVISVARLELTDVLDRVTRPHFDLLVKPKKSLFTSMDIEQFQRDFSNVLPRTLQSEARCSRRNPEP